MKEPDRIRVDFTNELKIEWNWDALLQDAATAGENTGLAVAGLVMSRNAEISSVLLEKTMRSLGFEDLKSDFYVLSTQTKNEVGEPARTFGHKLIEKNGTQYHIICAVFKGTTTVPDMITDIASLDDGFFHGGKNCVRSLKEYIDGIEGITKDNTVMFITGHSLGASTANVVGRLCRGLVKEEAEFVYTFASPNYETEGEAEDGKPYPNFRYYTNKNDVVPKVPLEIGPHFFSKIGKEHLFDYEGLDEMQKARFLRVYEYFRGIPFEEDTDLLGLGLKQTESLSYRKLKNHLAHTYMSFILSEQTEEEIDDYLVR